jgi:hypothetical protein
LIKTFRGMNAVFVPKPLAQLRARPIFCPDFLPVFGSESIRTPSSKPKTPLFGATFLHQTGKISAAHQFRA